MILNQWMRARKFRRETFILSAFELWRSDYAEWTFVEMKSLFYVGDFVLTLLSELTSKGLLAILSTKTAQLFGENFMNYFSSNCFTIGKLALAIKTLSFGGRTLRRFFMDRWRSSEMSLRHRNEVTLNTEFCAPHIMISNDPNFQVNHLQCHLGQKLCELPLIGHKGQLSVWHS